jgi:23S rRNA pseudouridine2605 synthase
LTAEQLEASRAERMRHNGHRALTLEDARTWIEETGLCLFLPKRQFSSSIAPSFVEAVAGHQNATPDPKHIQLAEELLVRLELDDVAVRLNLLGQPGEQPDFVVASWVLPYVYALRGDRDWRRSPQLTGSRQVSQLAVQAYKLLEAGDNNIAGLTHTLGREVTETAVIRAITELWQQLRIIPVVAAPGVAANWQLLRHRFQKAIAEGASTSQVTAISVLASIYLQAVIAASMEEVELFLAPLTARSKVREVLRGLVATRQVHTISMGHAPHFYVAGTLPEFSVAPTLYSSSSMPASAYFLRSQYEDELAEIDTPRQPAFIPAPAPVESHPPAETHTPRISAVDKPAASIAKPPAARPHFSRPAAHSRDRKPTQLSNGSRPVRRPAADTRSASARPAPRPAGARPGTGSRRAEGARAGAGPRWSPTAPSNGKAKHNGTHAGGGNGTAKGVHSNGKGAHPSNGSSARTAKSSTPAWSQRNGHAANGHLANGHAANGHAANGHAANGHAANGHSGKGVKPAGKSSGRASSLVRASGSPGPRGASGSRKDARPDARSSARNGSSRKPALAAGTKAGNSKRYGFTARPAASSPAKETKKRG